MRLLLNVTKAKSKNSGQTSLIFIITASFLCLFISLLYIQFSALNSKKVQLFNTWRNEVSEATKNLQLLLLKPYYCEGGFKDSAGSSVKLLPPDREANISFITGKFKESVDSSTFSEIRLIGLPSSSLSPRNFGNLKIFDMTLKRNGSNTTEIVIPSTNQILVPIVLTISSKVPSPSGGDFTTQDKFYFDVLIDNSGNINECRGQKAATVKKLCTDFFGAAAFDLATGVCTLPKPTDLAGIICSTGEFFRGFDGSGNKVCESVPPNPKYDENTFNWHYDDPI